MAAGNGSAVFGSLDDMAQFCASLVREGAEVEVVECGTPGRYRVTWTFPQVRS
jgi:hypothetical protein